MLQLDISAILSEISRKIKTENQTCIKCYIKYIDLSKPKFVILCTGSYVFIGEECRPWNSLTLKAPIKTAADDTHNYFFIVFQRNKTMFQVNPLLGRGFT